MRAGYKMTKLGEIPLDWEVKNLGEIVSINMGQSPSSTSYNEDGNGLYLIQGNADIKNRKSVPRFWTSDPRKECQVGDILMTVRAPVGAIAKSFHHACIGRGVCSISSQKLDLEYIYQYMISYEQSWSKLEQGSTFSAVNKSDVQGIRILVPPLQEQKKIAQILSIVDEKIDLVQSKIEATQALKKGLMQQLLTKGIGHTEFKESKLGEIPLDWEVVKVDTVCNKISVGIVIKPSQYYVESGVKCFRSANVREGYIEDENWVYMSKKSNELNSKSKLKKGDVLIVRTGYPGISCVVPSEFDGSNCIDIVFARPLLNLVDPHFLCCFNNSEFGKKQFFHGQTGLAQKHFNVGAYKKVNLILPPLEEQKKIAQILSTVDEKIDVLKEKKQAYQAMKKGLMQQLLTGQVRVKNYSNA